MVVIIESHAVCFCQSSHFIAGCGNCFDLFHCGHDTHRQDNSFRMHLDVVFYNLNHIFMGRGKRIKMYVACNSSQTKLFYFIADFFGAVAGNIYILNILIACFCNILQSFEVVICQLGHNREKLYANFQFHNKSSFLVITPIRLLS